MSKQKRGMFRRILDVGRKLMGKPVTHHYDDHFGDSPEMRRQKTPRYRMGKYERETKPSVAPPCRPGTITYHDKLVRHFGRRKAEGYRHCIQRNMHSALPTEEDFDRTVPWGFLKPHV
jgi:hypothetical protein